MYAPYSDGESLRWPGRSTAVSTVDETPLRIEVDAVCRKWARDAANGLMSTQSLDKFQLLARRYALYAEASGATALADVDDQIARGFITARGRTRQGRLSDSAIATQHLRRSVLRVLYRTARALGLVQTDPTIDVLLPPRSQQIARPLTDEEAQLVRRYAESRIRRTRHAAAVALAEVGAHTGEIGHLSIADLDLDASRVWVHGSGKTRSRWCPLDPWQTRVLEERSEYLRSRHPNRHETDLPLATSGRGTDAQLQARVCVALTDAIVWAGLADEPDVRPASITAHHAAALWAATGRLEDIAARLGLSSLDRAAAVVGYDWLASIRQNTQGPPGTSDA